MKTYKRTCTIYPATRSSWWKTHAAVAAAVAAAACPTCKVPIGQLCEPSFGFCRGSTHEARRRLLPRGEAVAMKIIAAEVP